MQLIDGIILGIGAFIVQQIIAGLAFGFKSDESEPITLEERRKNLVDKWHNHPNLPRHYTTIGWRRDPWHHNDGQTQHGNEYRRPINKK